MVIPQRLTEDQQAVVNAQGRICLAIAPAGSGKTEVLIRRIERLLDESPGESFRLLAVTFTLKAAEELKTRVSRSIGAKKLGGWTQIQSTRSRMTGFSAPVKRWASHRMLWCTPKDVTAWPCSGASWIRSMRRISTIARYLTC